MSDADRIAFERIAEACEALSPEHARVSLHSADAFEKAVALGAEVQRCEKPHVFDVAMLKIGNVIIHVHGPEIADTAASYSVTLTGPPHNTLGEG